MFDTPSGEQQFIYDQVAKIYLEFGKWPAWSFLEEQLERNDLNAEAVLRSIPIESSHSYSPLWPRRTPAPAPQDQVGLTIAGLMHVESAQLLVIEFLNLIDALGVCRESIRLDPFANERPKATRDRILHGRAPGSMRAPLVMPLLSREPATWLCVFEPLSAEWETVEMSPQIRRFAGVKTAEDYLDRMRLVLMGSPNPEQLFSSPFTLPASIDYLDVVWQLRFGKPLVVPPGVERSARLAFTATSAEEADTRLSALAELLKVSKDWAVTHSSDSAPS
jgi:hypothetical protein